MLDRFLNDDAAVQRMRGLPLGSQLDSFTAVLSALGYARASIRDRLWTLAALGKWLKHRGLAVTDLRRDQTAAFLKRRAPRRLVRRGDAATLRLFLDHLDWMGITTQQIATSSSSSSSSRPRHSITSTRSRQRRVSMSFSSAPAICLFHLACAASRHIRTSSTPRNRCLLLHVVTAKSRGVLPYRSKPHNATSIRGFSSSRRHRISRCSIWVPDSFSSR
jgi:hypothetical protein